MKAYFINPNKKPKGNKLITNEAEYEKLEYFLTEIEEMAPHVCIQLYDLVSFYHDATDIALKRNKEGKDIVTKWPQNWKNLNEGKIPEFEKLRDLLSEWATKNYLIGYKLHERFMIIALNAIYEYCYRVQDKQYNQEIYGNSEPKISLISGLEFLVTENPDDFEVQGENFPFSKIFPFAFSPSLSEWIDKEKEGLFNYKNFCENLLRYERVKTELFKMPQEETEKYAQYKEDWEDGASWDPRFTTWKEFEEKIDLLFDYYKAFYKQRTEKFLEDNYGFTQSTMKKRPEHFKWLVLSQLEGMTARQIIERLNLSVGERTISDAIEKSAEDIDLKPREKNKGGRPRNK